MITLDDGALHGLARRPEVLAEFPELAPLLRQKPGCCGGGRSDQASISVRVAMAGLSDFRRLRLKELLGGAAQVKISYRAGGALKSVVF